MSQRSNLENTDSPFRKSNINDKDAINWRLWYVVLLIFLLVQLLAYSVITKFYE